MRTDMAALRELLTEHGPSGFRIVGVSVDNTAGGLSGYLTKNRLPWEQIFEKGGLDSRPANELGILTVPTMILIDRQGRSRKPQYSNRRT